MAENRSEPGESSQEFRAQHGRVGVILEGMIENKSCEVDMIGERSVK